MKQDLLLISSYWIEDVTVQGYSGGDVQAEHESLGVVRVPVTAKKNEQGEMPITRDRKAPVTLTLLYFMID